jgi:hypothetical protein
VSDANHLKDAVEVWKKTVDVQQHFNDLQLRIRNLAITVVAAIVSASGLTLVQKLHITFLGADFPVAVFLQATALASWGAFFVMDRYWYYRLLLAAVGHGVSIEKSIKKSLPEIGLATHISIEIPEKHTTSLMYLFYAIGAAILSVLIVLTALVTPPPIPS